MPDNLLGRETSPYLRQHASNPVAWRPWGPDALAEAKRLGRPILLSIGYAACHWCHVMAHESFEDDATAKVMNRLFVNIKVDREERPDVDHIYMSALQALGEQGGWPLTMFLTPDAEPIWGGTYFPATARYGRPAFVDVLESVHRTFVEHPERIEANRTALLDHLRELPAAEGAGADAAALEEAADLVAGLFDRKNGGLGGAPKFPQPTLLELLWRSAERTANSEHRELVLTSLTHMSQGGIYDHVGGGLSRYSVDESWLVPHFEKMLYDNALFLERLTAAWLATGKRLFRVRIEETVAWLFREMRVDGAFASSLDADSEGGEGRFYVWRQDELAEILGRTDAREFAAVYDITPTGNFEGASVPNRLADVELFAEPDEARLAGMRAKLLEARGRRPRPARDDKILADWNGLVIAALAGAATALGRTDWLDAAGEAYRFIRGTMTVDGRLRHSYKDGTLLPVGFAADGAAMMKAAIALHQAALDDRYLEDAARFAETLDRYFWDAEASAYRMTADDAEALIMRPLPLFDDSVPSANAIIATALARLASLTGERSYADRADRILGAHCGAARSVLGKGGLFNALDQRIGGVDIVLIAPSAEAAGALLETVRMNWRSVFTLLLRRDGDPLPVSHPAHGKTASTGRPTAYVCRGQTCSAPVTDPADLAALLTAEG